MLKKYFKKVAFFVVLASLLPVAGFGCKGLTGEQKQAIKPVSLEYWTVFDDVDEIQKIAKRYTAQRSYLSVNIKQLREDELYSRLVEALADDNGPDIISV